VNAKDGFDAAKRDLEEKLEKELLAYGMLVTFFIYLVESDDCKTQIDILRCAALESPSAEIPGRNANQRSS